MLFNITAWNYSIMQTAEDGHKASETWGICVQANQDLLLICNGLDMIDCLGLDLSPGLVDIQWQILPSPLSFLSLSPLRSKLGPPEIQLVGVGERPAGCGVEPQPRSNLVHFSLKIWRTILLILLRIDWPHFVWLTRQDLKKSTKKTLHGWKISVS